MTEQEMKAWIDSASYYELLRKWRFAVCPDPFFQGRMGFYYEDVMAKKKKAIGEAEAVRISKIVGWGTI